MRRKTDAERANINARTRIQRVRTIATLNRIVREELEEYAMEPETLLVALRVARSIGFADGVKDATEG